MPRPSWLRSPSPKSWRGSVVGHLSWRFMSTKRGSWLRPSVSLTTCRGGLSGTNCGSSCQLLCRSCRRMGRGKGLLRTRCQPPPLRAAKTVVVGSPLRPGSSGTTFSTIGGRRPLRRRTMGRPGSTATMPAALRVEGTPRRCRTTPTGGFTAPRALVLGVVPLITTRIRGAATAMTTAPT